MADDSSRKRIRSPATVEAAYHLLAQIMRTAEIDGMIPKTPCEGIKLPREYSKQDMVFLNARQVRKLAETIDPTFRLLIYTAAYTGMRAGELSGTPQRSAGDVEPSEVVERAPFASDASHPRAPTLVDPVDTQG